MSTIRYSIREAMRSQSVTQASLAAKSHVSQGHLSEFLSGKCDMRGDTIERLLVALGLILTKNCQPTPENLSTNSFDNAQKCGK